VHLFQASSTVCAEEERAENISGAVGWHNIAHGLLWINEKAHHQEQNW
jgi:hypothetical protein